MTAPQNPRVRQADEDVFGAITDCLKTAEELRSGGGCGQVEQAIFWERKAKEFVARHREAAEAEAKAREAALVEADACLAEFVDAYEWCSEDPVDRGTAWLDDVARKARAIHERIIRAALTKEPDA